MSGVSSRKTGAWRGTLGSFSSRSSPPGYVFGPGACSGALRARDVKMPRASHTSFCLPAHLDTATGAPASGPAALPGPAPELPGRRPVVFGMEVETSDDHQTSQSVLRMERGRGRL